MPPEAPPTTPRQSGAKVVAAACLGVLALMAAVNGLVDPYGYFGTPGVPGLSVRKPTSFQHDRYLKAGLARRVQADCILAGNSRIGEGISIGHEVFKPCQRVLDLSLAGPNVAETVSSIDHALERNPGAQVIANLDFFSFNALRPPTRGGDESNFRDSLFARTTQATKVLLSKDVTADSLFTLTHQQTASFYEPQGNVSEDHLRGVSKERPTRATFLRGVRGYIFHFLPAPTYDFRAETASQAPLADLAQFLARQHRAQAKLTLFLSPAHVWQWELIDALSLESNWQDWKRSLVRINEEQARLAGRPPFQLWDFSSYGSYSTEAVPPTLAMVGPLDNYWDNSHFRHALGDRILDRMFDRPQADPRFGVLLTTANVETVIADRLQDRARWRAAHAQDVQEIRSVVVCFAPPELLQRLRLAPGEVGSCRRLAAITR